MIADRLSLSIGRDETARVEGLPTAEVSDARAGRQGRRSVPLADAVLSTAPEFLLFFKGIQCRVKANTIRTCGRAERKGQYWYSCSTSSSERTWKIFQQDMFVGRSVDSSRQHDERLAGPGMYGHRVRMSSGLIPFDTCLQTRGQAFPLMPTHCTNY